MDGSHGDCHLARRKIRPPTRLDRDRIRHPPYGIAGVTVEPRRIDDARDNEGMNHGRVDDDQRGSDGAVPPYFIRTNITSKRCCRAAWK